MDFSRFDSRAAADKPQAMHIKSPVNGKPLYDDGDKSKPCRVLVYGIEGNRGQDAVTAAQRARMKDREADRNEPRSLSEIQAGMVKEFAPLIAGFENVNRGDKPATEEDAEWFLGLNFIGGNAKQQSFVEQVRDFATDRGNYLGNV
ncbi:MAG: hypothetical protein H6881_08330 [Rhodobiaceae bacterium]|nr:hypothetical protein [Rhodobiaceae bacterium]MCC0051870.1 hypothetical protein [Rhodobiaceae bacterium]